MRSRRRTRPVTPTPFHKPVQGRWWRRIAPAAGLTEMGASHVTLDPGAWSSQRHWHDDEDEMVIMLSGTAVLVEDDGEKELGPAMSPPGRRASRTATSWTIARDQPCTFIAISAGPRTTGGYSDIDMIWSGNGRFCHRDGMNIPSAADA